MTHLEYSRIRSTYSGPRDWRYMMVGNTPAKFSCGPDLNLNSKFRAGSWGREREGERGREGEREREGGKEGGRKGERERERIIADR